MLLGYNYGNNFEGFNMLKIIRVSLKSIAIMCLMSSSAIAAIISIGGDITVISSPVSVEPGALESSSTIWAFEEKQAYTLGADLNVDEFTGTSASGVLSAGTVVNSYFLHSDPVGSSVEEIDIINLTGTITFNTKILGVIWTGEPCNGCPASPMNLDASDHLGLLSTTYPTGGLGRGYEVESFYDVNGTRDFVTISADGYSLTTISSAAFPLFSDQLRVITAVVPVPAAVWLFGTGLVGLLGFARRQQV